MITQIAILQEPHFSYKLPSLSQYTIAEVLNNTVTIEGKSINKNLVICLPNDTAWERLNCLYNNYQRELNNLANQLRSLKNNQTKLSVGDRVVYAIDPDNNQPVSSSVWEIKKKYDMITQLHEDGRVELAKGEIVSIENIFPCPDKGMQWHLDKSHTACEIASNEARKYFRELGTYADAENDGRYSPEFKGMTLDEIKASKLIASGKLEIERLENLADKEDNKNFLKIQDKMTALGRKLRELKQFIEIQPGWTVEKSGRKGLVLEKALSIGGMPELCVIWDGSESRDMQNLGNLKFFPPENPLNTTENISVVEVAQIEPETINHIYSKPALKEDAPTAIILFAGGGGVEAGMVAAGIRPIISVELDPTKPELSSRIADIHHKNFSEYGGKVIRQTVQEVAASDFQDFPRNPDFLHASPVCSNFSLAKGKEAIETEEDIAASEAVAKAIALLQPTNFTLEQVPGYLRSSSYKRIKATLDEHSYNYEVQVINTADYGVPQARRRLIVRATKNELPPLPAKQNHVGWYEAIAHLIPGMKDSELVAGQQRAVEKFLSENKPTPLFLFRSGEYRCTKASLPARTIRRCFFTDGEGANRNQWADIWLPDGTVKSVSIQAAAILQGFPDWYELPKDTSTAGSILGYSVPPLFASQVFSEWLNPNSQPLTPELPTPNQHPTHSLELPTPNTALIEKLLPGYASGELTKEQAEKLVNSVCGAANRIEALMAIAVKKANLIRMCVNLLDVGHGYEKLGFKSMTEMFKSGILGYSRSNLQKQWQAAQVEMNLAVEIGTLPEDHCRKLSPLIAQPELLKQAYDDAVKRAEEEKNKKLTAKLIASSVAAITGETKPLKSKTKWKRNRDGSRHYHVDLCGVERQVHQDVYQEECTNLEKISQVQNRTPESLIVEGLLKLVTDKYGCTDQGAIALAIKEILNQSTGEVAA